MHPDTLQLIAAERLADLRRSGRPVVKPSQPAERPRRTAGRLLRLRLQASGFTRAAAR
jgi:hypothetical protein